MSGVKVHINHFKALGRSSWNYFQGAIEMIKNAKNEGVKITCDFFPYTKTGSDLITLLPLWFRKMSSMEAEKILREKGGKERESLLESLRQMTLHFDRIIIASTATEFGIAGKTVEQLVALSESSGEEIILRLLETNNLRVSIFNEVIFEENIKTIGKENFSTISSDGVGYTLTKENISNKEIRDFPHPRSFGTFPRAINLFVKNEQILKWEELIYKMSGLPAEILGIRDRGVITEGRKADIIIFNPGEISDYSTYDKPYQYSKGVDYVIVNGVSIIDNDIFTKRSVGKILRKK
jgi:N-acyl-D-amino-acid deacylase